jgi:hypothetical protein
MWRLVSHGMLDGDSVNPSVAGCGDMQGPRIGWRVVWRLVGHRRLGGCVNIASCGDMGGECLRYEGRGIIAS